MAADKERGDAGAGCEAHAGDAASPSCSFSTSDRYSCRTVEGEEGKVFKECERKREVIRHCWGRAPEVLESQTEMTREELPGSGSSSLSTYSWSNSNSSSSSSSSIWGAAPPVMPAQPDSIPSNPWSSQGIPLPLPNQGAAPWVWDRGTHSGFFGMPYGSSAEIETGSGSVGELLSNAEQTFRSAMEQLGQELREFRPFRGFPQLFEGSSSSSASASASASGSGDSAAAGVTVEERHAGGERPRLNPNRSKKNPYDGLSRDFDEV